MTQKFTMHHSPLNILVAGGAGFLGSNLVGKLLDLGHAVWVIDNLITGREKNIEAFFKNKNFVFIKKNISSFDFLEDEVLADLEFDEIYHLASPASPPKYQKEPIETLHVNSTGTENLLKLALKHNSKFFYASTSEIYGDPEVHPQPETYWGHVNSFGPRACYDEAKRYGEALCYVYQRKYNLDIKIARIFNTYGPYMDPQDGRVISNFINQALAGKDITVYGDGQQSRSYCYVDDLIDGFLKLMASGENTPVNLGNPDEYTVLETAKIILRLIDSKSKIIYQDLPKDDPTRRRPDITKAREILNWQPKVSLKEGLKKTIEYFKAEAVLK